MKMFNYIPIVCLLALSNNMLANSEAYSDNAWDIQNIRDFEHTYKKQDYNVAFLTADVYTLFLDGRQPILHTFHKMSSLE